MQVGSRSHVRIVVLALGLILTLSSTGTLGCAAIQRAEAEDTERTLAAAGFQMRLADTPEKLAKISAEPQHELTPRSYLGKTFWIYADATDCKCLWVGTERAERHYQRLRMRQQIANEEVMAADARESAAMDIGAFGPWGPWWY